MIPVHELLGRAEEAAFAGRRRDVVSIDWADATRRRLRRTSRDGLDIAISLPRGMYLADGVVLADDGVTIIVVERAVTPSLVVTLDTTMPVSELIRVATLIGHAFGNQHVPVDIADGSIRVPLTTSEDVALATVESLSLHGIDATVRSVPLALMAPLSVGAHGHEHVADPSHA